MGATGRIHSLESFGTHEGPGIRYVVFMQGCRARCRYCHNPDSWAPEGGREMTAEEAFREILKCKEYFMASGGGVTASGGEPLWQAEFLCELFGLCREEGIHTAIDTSGFVGAAKAGETNAGTGTERLEMLDALEELIGLTDLFLVDLKWTDPARHREMTGRELAEPLALIERLERRERPYWIRNVLAPGLNDGEADLRALGRILAGLRRCERFEFLPYHTLGAHKWEALGMKYPLQGVRAATEADVARAMEILERGKREG